MEKAEKYYPLEETAHSGKKGVEWRKKRTGGNTMDKRWMEKQIALLVRKIKDEMILRRIWKILEREYQKENQPNE